jgi:hypothetical protein
LFCYRAGLCQNDAAQRDNRFTATFEALHLQLIQLQQDTATLDTPSSEVHKLFQQQVQAITVNSQHDFNIHSINALRSNSLSKFQKLELLVNTNSEYIAADYEQYKVIVDTLAKDSVPCEKFCQLETTINGLKDSQAATHQQHLQSTEQQCTDIKNMMTQLEDLDTRHKQLQKFIDDYTRVTDPALRRTLNSQLVIVRTMQREIDLYRQDIRARMSSEMDTLRQTVADIAIKTILSR